jgi:hypothetical protein
MKKKKQNSLLKKQHTYMQMYIVIIQKYEMKKKKN